MPTREKPYGAYNFLVEIDGLAVPAAAFAEVSGLGAEVEVVEYRTGGDRENVVRKIPGLAKFPNLVLKRGVVGDTALLEWLQRVVDGDVQPANGSVILLAENREEVVRWNFVNGWPCRWTGPTLSARANEVAIETLEICHEGLRIVT